VVRSHFRKKIPLRDLFKKYKKPPKGLSFGGFLVSDTSPFDDGGGCFRALSLKDDKKIFLVRFYILLRRSGQRNKKFI